MQHRGNEGTHERRGARRPLRDERGDGGRFDSERDRSGGRYEFEEEWQQPRFAEGLRYEERPTRRVEADGPHAGRGPKGYQRPDERVLDDACQALERDPHLDASEIEVSCQKGEIVLRGSVDSRDAKRRAERCIEDLPGVKDVRNELRLLQSPAASQVGSAGKLRHEEGAASRNGR